MMYQWKCNACLRCFEQDVKVDDYDDFKKKAHTCPLCGKESHFERVIEWNGPANNLGGYSDVGGRAQWQ